MQDDLSPAIAAMLTWANSQLPAGTVGWALFGYLILSWGCGIVVAYGVKPPVPGSRWTPIYRAANWLANNRGMAVNAFQIGRTGLMLPRSIMSALGVVDVMSRIGIDPTKVSPVDLHPKAVLSDAELERLNAAHAAAPQNAPEIHVEGSTVTITTPAAIATQGDDTDQANGADPAIDHDAGHDGEGGSILDHHA